ncbi:polysaccharide biosynthesis tyrosine autokinase [Patescibacteria group bacterium]|nr:polysaccharide biosynthesis tyrosine autokinase [Patescibacteria group bacterium]
MNEHNPFLEQEVDLREYLHVLYKKRWLIISFTVILCTLSLIRSFMMKPVYLATTRILIQKEAPRVVKMDEVASMDYSGREYYKTQYKILQSRSLAEKVYKASGKYEPWNEWTGRKKRKEGKPLTSEDGARALLKRVEIIPISNTELVEIDVEDIDPELASKISNLWAENYISYIIDTKFDATQYASGWLQEKIKEAKGNVEKAELELQEYRKANRIIVDSVDNETSMLGQLLKRKADLEIALSEALEYYKEKHPEIIGIRSELLSVEEKIESEKEKELNAKDKEIQYNILRRDVDISREIYNSLLKRIQETEVTGGLKTTNIRIIDRAIVPKKSVRPRKKLNLLIAFCLGIIGGGGLAFLFESLDQSVKTPDDIKKWVKLPVLASIAVPSEKESESLQPEFITLKKPQSTISEAYRSLRTSIMFTAVEHRRKTLLVTSSEPKEGKTTTAVNLAIIMAQTGEKTVLIDADLRHPRIKNIFSKESRPGLTEVLAGSENIESVIDGTDIQNLDVVQCGSIPPNPSELLGSKKMDELLEELEKKYDRIIIDSPPVLAVTDAVVLSGKVDGTIIIVKANDTHRNAMIHAKEVLESVESSHLIGSILNMVETHKTGGYYYYGKYGKYGEYGKYYGDESDRRGRRKRRKKHAEEEKEMETQPA